MDKIIQDIEEYSDRELEIAWDHLEKLKLTPYVEQKMNEIASEIERRSVKKTLT